MPQRPFCPPFFGSCLFRDFCPAGVLIFAFFFWGMGVGVAQPVVLSPSTVAATCDQSNGRIIVKFTGDNHAPYTVSLTGGTPLIAPRTVITNADTALFDNVPGGNYAFVVADAAGTAAAPGIVSLGDLKAPTITALDPIPATCLNDDGQVVVTLTGGGATPYTFFYNGQTVGTTNLQEDTAKGLPSGPVTLVVQDNNGCTTNGATFVNFNDDITFSMDPGYTICQGTDTTIKVTTNATAFNWRPATGLSSATVQDPIASPATTTNYTVVATRGICSAFGEVLITVLPAPVADAGGPVDTTCFGKSVQLQGSGGEQYFWTPITGLSGSRIADPVVIDPTSTITYSLNVVDGNGCTSLSPSKVKIYVRAPYRVFAGHDSSIMVGQSIPLHAVDVDNVGFSTFAWTPASGLSDPFSADPTASFSAIGEYTYAVTATAPDGCTAADSIDIKVYALSDIYVPTAFTPNHDGHNDLLRVLPVSIRDFKYLSVFNRWGQQVFTTTNAGIGWDGTYNGQEMPPGTYVWMAGGVDYNGRVVERRGTVVLIR